MVGHAALDRVIGVRIPASQPNLTFREAWAVANPNLLGRLIRGFAVACSLASIDAHRGIFCLRKTMDMKHNGATRV